MTVKAIETTYAGHLFRSRLEARWAVFFNTLRVKWEYEKEGYNLGKLGGYLPDFWLPQLELFVEIKPVPAQPRVTELMQRFRDEVRPIVLFDRFPNPVALEAVSGTLFAHDINDSNGGSSEWPATWVFCPKHFRAELAFGWSNKTITDMDFNPLPHCWDEKQYRGPARILLAVDEMRQARFEHGQVGAPSQWGLPHA